PVPGGACSSRRVHLAGRGQRAAPDGQGLHDRAQLLAARREAIADLGRVGGIDRAQHHPGGLELAQRLREDALRDVRHAPAQLAETDFALAEIVEDAALPLRADDFERRLDRARGRAIICLVAFGHSLLSANSLISILIPGDNLVPSWPRLRTEPHSGRGDAARAAPAILTRRSS